MPIAPEQVLAVLERGGRPAYTPKALLRELGAGRHDLKALRRVLRGLMAEGRVERLEGRYRVPRADGLRDGEIRASAGGRRQVLDESGNLYDAVSDELAAAAADGDRVLFQVRSDGRALVIHVKAATRASWVGILDRESTGGFVTPYRDDAAWGIRIPRSGLGAARDGDVVVVELEKRRRGPAAGRIVEVLGPPGSPEADFRAVVWHRRLPVEFSTEALAEAEAFSPALSPEEIARRVDLRERAFLTIDPASARDHDDAVCVESAPGGATRLWVAIADVSHYVREGSALDADAVLRSTSVYFPDRAIPMLPERLSGGLCSLRPDEERPALCAELLFDGRGKVTRRSFYPAVIRSRARLAYSDAAAVMEGEAGAGSLGEETRRQLVALAELTQRLQRRRREAGSIDFELPAARVVLDDEGRPIDIVREPRTVAHRAIEDAMLAANRAVSSALAEAGAPALYRVHEPPLAGDMQELLDLLQSFGLVGKRPRDSVLAPAEVAAALRKVKGRPEERLVNLVSLRCMRQARYADRDLGHYALAFDSYTHFTSPIRRYPDLVVHRALKDLLAGDAPARRRAEARRSGLAAVASRASFRERLAEAAEREMMDLKKCAFMAPRVGEVFEGTVSGVARHGFYVTLDECFVEGLVHVSRLPGYAIFEERSHQIVLRGTRRRWRLADRVRVLLDSVDPVKAWINLSLADEPIEPRRPKHTKRPRGRRRR
jgi:ribonuclease R